MGTTDGRPKDYPEPLDDPDPFDPTGYYRRKAEHRAEMYPYLGWLFVAGLVMIAVVVLKEITMITTVTLVAFGAGLIVGWNVLPQPAWVKGLYDKVRVKLSG